MLCFPSLLLTRMDLWTNSILSACCNHVLHETTPSEDNACSTQLLQAELVMSVSFNRSGLGNASDKAAVASKGRHAGRAPFLLP